MVNFSTTHHWNFFTQIQRVYSSATMMNNELEVPVLQEDQLVAHVQTV
jgi:hypothetical protein